jgi:hypothetical protein
MDCGVLERRVEGELEEDAVLDVFFAAGQSV